MYMQDKFKFTIQDSTPRLATNKHWQWCVGSGQAKLALRADYGKQLKMIHDTLGIQRVRFHGIFDDSMQTYMGLDDFMPMPGSKKFTNYNFHNIGIVYDNVLAAGMQPWVELSFMPSRLAKKDKKVTVNAEGRASMPRDDSEWRDFIQAFISYLLHRYGKDEVETWYFEVWNEPNMSTFFSGSKEDYFHLYQITAEAIKDVDANLMVGGPATATGAWISDFIAFCEEGHVPLDFIVTHNYPGDGIGEVFLGKIMFDAIVGGMKRLQQIGGGRVLDGCQAIMEDKSEKSEMPKGQMYEHCRMVSNQVAGKYPLFYSEWNCNAILTSPSNDTRKVACFQVKSISEMEKFVTGSSIWCFSDIFDEFMLMPDPFSGGFGLLTVDGIPKPQYYALQLMNRAGERKYDLPYTNDEVEIAVYENDREKQIFVYRQRMKNVAEADISYEISLELPKSPQTISLYRIDEEHCNPLKEWRKIGSPLDMNQVEIDQIIEKSSLQEEEVTVVYADNKLHIEQSIGVNDVHCYIVEMR